VPSDVSAPPTDRVGYPMPAEAAPAFACLSDFEAVNRLHVQLAQLVDKLAQSPGGAAWRQHLVRKIRDGKPVYYSPELQLFSQKSASAAPHCGYCPRCHAKQVGAAQANCKLCGGRGWLSKGEFEACPQQERQELGRLRNQQADGR
jgi:hypothetical protein